MAMGKNELREDRISTSQWEATPWRREGQHLKGKQRFQRSNNIAQGSASRTQELKVYLAKHHKYGSILRKVRCIKRAQCKHTTSWDMNMYRTNDLLVATETVGRTVSWSTNKTKWGPRWGPSCDKHWRFNKWLLKGAKMRKEISRGEILWTSNIVIG